MSLRLNLILHRVSAKQHELQGNFMAQSAVAVTRREVYEKHETSPMAALTYQSSALSFVSAPRDKAVISMVALYVDPRQRIASQSPERR